MQFGSGVSNSPNTSAAVDQALRGSLLALSAPPDLLVAFASPHHLGDVSGIAARLSDTTSVSGVSIGAVATGVIADGLELEGGPALTVWAASLPTGEISGVRLRMHETAQGAAVSGWRQPDNAAVSILLADPFSFPTPGFVESLSLPVVGGLVNSGSDPAAVFLDGAVFRNGAVAITLGGSMHVGTVVSQGCRPIGQAAVVTAVDGQKLLELGGRSALEFLQRTLDEATENDRAMAKDGLHLGVVVDEYAGDYSVGEFLIRDVMGIDDADGSILIGDRLPLGHTVQFHIRDRATATDELRQRLASLPGGGGALVFTSNSRGEGFFGEPDHDAGWVSRSLRPAATAGMRSVGEIGPLAGKNLLHGHSVTVVVISEA